MEGEIAKILLAPRPAGEAAAFEAAQEILRLLRADAVHRAVERSIAAAYISADAAASEREDLYHSPRDSMVVAAVAARAALEVLAPEGAAPAMHPEALGATVRGIRYKDWQFDLVKIPPDTLAVRVCAPFPDARRDSGVFHVTRIALVRKGGAVQAAFSAIMMIEEHEARERLLVNGQRVLDPHDASDMPAPTNLRHREGR